MADDWNQVITEQQVTYTLEFNGKFFLLKMYPRGLILILALILASNFWLQT